MHKQCANMNITLPLEKFVSSVLVYFEKVFVCFRFKYKRRLQGKNELNYLVSSKTVLTFFLLFT